MRESAAASIGASRLPAALQLLRNEWKKSIDASYKQLLLSAIAAMRTNAAIDFLLACIRDENNTTALAAVAAMAVHKHDIAIRDRVAAAVAERDEMSVTKTFELQFD